MAKYSLCLLFLESRAGASCAGAMFYGAPVWDPALIVAQIVTLQCLFYLSLGALLFLFVGARAGDDLRPLHCPFYLSHGALLSLCACARCRLLRSAAAPALPQPGCLILDTYARSRLLCSAAVLLQAVTWTPCRSWWPVRMLGSSALLQRLRYLSLPAALGGRRTLLAALLCCSARSPPGHGALLCWCMPPTVCRLPSAFR